MRNISAGFESECCTHIFAEVWAGSEEKHSCAGPAGGQSGRHSPGGAAEDKNIRFRGDGYVFRAFRDSFFRAPVCRRIIHIIFQLDGGTLRIDAFH